ncbi:FixH family protein [Flavobacterium sp. CYK-55]|uniref:FixH family protein n=1 Tax=Flavobacterium sp. CYK-55 TaxID=2835529 RepID=UPI001BCB03D4|nr:FixH family protein [Flavobacterium sp. CYK-55]MBS7787942.1 FixH family protein [Flavobacterium sp. CYK-55]
MATDIQLKTKFSLNWGHYIVMAFVLFMIFIGSFVYRVQSNPKYDNELVVDDYYKHDVHFSDELDQYQNTEKLAHKPQISTSAEGILLTFPSDIDSQKVQGKVSFYRPSDKKLDFEWPFSKTSPTLLIPKSKLAGGLWDITVSWQYEEQSFLMKQTLYY